MVPGRFPRRAQPKRRALWGPKHRPQPLAVRARLVPGPEAARQRWPEQGRGEERPRSCGLLQPPRGAQGPLLRGPAGPRQRADPADGGHRPMELRLPGEGRGGAAGAGRGGPRKIPRPPLAARMGTHNPHGRLPVEPRRGAPSARPTASPAKALADDRLKNDSTDSIRVPDGERSRPYCTIYPESCVPPYYTAFSLRETGIEEVWVVGSLIICASVMVHGVTATPLTKLYGRYQ